MKCPIGLECIKHKVRPDCINLNYCNSLVHPLKLPYEQRWDTEYQCNILKVFGLSDYWYRQNTIKDIREYGWMPAQYLPYQWQKDDYGWYKNVTFNSCETGSFMPAHPLPYSYSFTKKNLIVINSVSPDWGIAEPSTVFWDYEILNDKSIKLVVLKNRPSKGWFKPENLPYRFTKKGLWVTRDIKGYYYKPVSLRPKTIYHPKDISSIPGYLKCEGELLIMKLRPPQITQSTSYFDTQNGTSYLKGIPRLVPLWDYRKCFPINF